METSHAGQAGNHGQSAWLCSGQQQTKEGQTDIFKVWQKCATRLWGCACGCDSGCERVTVGMCVCGKNVHMTGYVCVRDGG